MKPPLIDNFNRVIKKLRISVTDHCNLRCQYCMPEEGMRFMPKSEVLSYEEIDRLAGIFVALGVEHFRLTGGEPLVRRDLPKLVKMLSQHKIHGLQSIGLTTNGVFLPQMLEALLAEGVDHVNVSLDTTDAKKFKQLTRRDLFEETIKGLEHACTLMPSKVKVNAVIQHDVNVDDIIPLVNLAHDMNFELRFIEKMPLDAQSDWRLQQVVTQEKIMKVIEEKYSFKEQTNALRGASPSDVLSLKEREQKIGFISSVTKPFCDSCDRMRLTADGALRNCLFSTEETPLKPTLRSGGDDLAVEALIRQCVAAKWEGHKINASDFVPASRSMSQVGG